jgi:hypothetical protein
MIGQGFMSVASTWLQQNLSTFFYTGCEGPEPVLSVQIGVYTTKAVKSLI